MKLFALFCMFWHNISYFWLYCIFLHICRVVVKKNHFVENLVFEFKMCKIKKKLCYELFFI